jgi:hypothetical protein
MSRMGNDPRGGGPRTPRTVPRDPPERVTSSSANETRSAHALRANRVALGLYSLPEGGPPPGGGLVSPFRVPLDIEVALGEPHSLLSVLPGTASFRTGFRG